jgi:nucleotide-binding universal stress UspA family protein
MFKVIMAPTDGSDLERPAIALAVRLAKRFDAELRLVRVETPPVAVDPASSPGVLEITEETVAEARRARLGKLEALGAECRTLGEIRVITALENGIVAPTLVDYAKRVNVDLIVMSSHARGGLKRLTLGSVTDFLIRRSDIPVLVVKPSASMTDGDPAYTLSRILVPLDGSAVAEQILPLVASVAARLHATVSLIYVLTPLTYAQKQIMQPGLPWWDEDIATANAYLTEVASRLGAAGLTAGKEVVLSENIPSAILDYSLRMRADLIAIATHGRGGVSRLLFGGVADEVTRKSRTSLLVFHPEQITVQPEPAAADEARNHIKA